MDKRILLLFFLISGFAFSQTTVTLEDQCNCDVLSGILVTAPGSATPTGADIGDIYVNTDTGTIYFWDGNSWELTFIDTNTTNMSLTQDGTDLILTDSDSNSVRLALSSFAAVADKTTITGAGTTADPFKVQDLSIITGKLADGAVTTAKLDADVVTNEKLADNAVRTENIINETILSEDIKDGEIATN